jgi:hypothetical protein
MQSVADPSLSLLSTLVRLGYRRDLYAGCTLLLPLILLEARLLFSITSREVLLYESKEWVFGQLD